MFCNCAFCNSVREAGLSEMRTRSQVLIDDDLSIDFPPEAYYHAQRDKINLSALRYILVTHSHMDHFYAHDFILRGYKYATLQEDVLNIYGNAEVAKVFAECTAREMKSIVAPHVKMNVIRPFTELTLGHYRILAIPAEHSKSEDALLFYVEKNGKGYLHLYDTGNLSAQAVSFLKDNNAFADVVAYDCTFGNGSGNLSARHMGIDDVVKVREALLNAGVAHKNTRSVITHFSHNCNPTAQNLAELEKNYGVVAAYDGMIVEI